ncbi:MAG: hypothetical protein ACK5MP_09395 [Nostocoides sp.]
MPTMMFVCTGNICRSPYAERYAAMVADRLGRSDWSFASAGIAAMVGEGMDTDMRRELEKRGGSGEDFVSRQFETPLLDRVDWVIAMEAHHRTWVLEDHPRMFRRIVTLGQVGAGMADIASVAEGGPLDSDALVAAVAAHPGSQRSEDIPDPYRRGVQASAEAAERISGLLDDVLGRVLATA